MKKTVFFALWLTVQVLNTKSLVRILDQPELEYKEIEMKIDGFTVSKVQKMKNPNLFRIELTKSTATSDSSLLNSPIEKFLSDLRCTGCNENEAIFKAVSISHPTQGEQNNATIQLILQPSEAFSDTRVSHLPHVNILSIKARKSGIAKIAADRPRLLMG